MIVNELLGTWRLVEMVRLVDATVVGYPFGEDCVGQLTYQPDGRMSGLLMRRDRNWPAEVEFVSATAHQRSEAGLGFLGYGGTYTSNAIRVIHKVEISLYPEMVGTQAVRDITWKGEHLVLTSEPRTTRSGRTMRDQLEWQRTQRQIDQ